MARQPDGGALKRSVVGSISVAALVLGLALATPAAAQFVGTDGTNGASPGAGGPGGPAGFGGAVGDGGTGGNGGTNASGTAGGGALGGAPSPGGSGPAGGGGADSGGGGGSASTGTGGGGGGGGGRGMTITNPGPTTVLGFVTGGNGGVGGNGVGATAPDGGGGGGGGNAIVMTGGSALTLNGVVAGGNGGAGGNAGQGDGFDGSGGAGGNALVTTLAVPINVNFSITGGTGGASGNGGGGNGGAGGSGIVTTVAGATLNINAAVAGGNGGAALGNGVITGTGVDGAGGIGITGSGLTVNLGATVAGGLSGDGVTRNFALSFTGGTSVLNLNAGFGITGGIDIAGGGTLQITPASNAVLSSVISGGGALSLTGSNTLTLSGTNTYAGGTTITGGTIAVTDDSNLGNVAGGLTFNGGTLRVSSGGGPAVALARAITLQAGGGTVETTIATILTGNITGAGGLTKTGTALLSLAGTNNYTGATNVMSGQLQSDSAGAFSAASAFTVAAGAKIELRGSQQSIGSLAGAGAVTNNNVAPAVLTTGFDNTSTTFSGVMSDAIVGPLSLVKVGSGTQTLSGVNIYGGTTTVNGGTLAVNGSIASSSLTTVNAGGTLGGNGTVGNTTINGGTLSPGNSIGTLTVSGSLTLTAASTYLVQISGTSSDKTIVTGTANLAGKVSVDPLARIAATTTYTIITAGTVNGTFSAADFLAANSFARNARLSYVGNNVLLTVDPGLLSPNLPANANINQKNVAAGIDNALIAGASMPAGFNALFALTGSGLAGALTQVSGEIATGTQQNTFNAMNQFMGVMTDPFIAGRGDPISGGSTPNAFADEESLAYTAKRKPNDALAAIYTKAPPIVQSFEQRWSVWAAAFGGSQRTDGNTIVGSNNTSSSLYGTAVGADYRFSPNTIAGFALAGGGTNFSVANNLGGGRSDLFQAGAFIRHNAGPAYITGALAYGWQDITTDRTITVAGVDRLRAQFNANAWSGRVEGGYRFVAPGFGITPYAAGQFTTFELPAYGEQAIVGSNVFALAYNSKSVTDTRSELGLRTDKSFAMQNAILTLRGRAAWAHDFNPDRSIGATFQTLPGASFVVNGAAMASDSALVTGAAEMKWINGWSAAATFEGEFSNVTRSYAGKGVVRYAW